MRAELLPFKWRCSALDPIPREANGTTDGPKLAKIGVRAMFGGALASCMTATMIGFLFTI